MSQLDAAATPSLIKKSLQIAGSLALAGLFLWLALKSVDVNELWEHMSSVSLWWLLLFVPATLTSHWIRALRWKLLLHGEGIEASRLTLFTGVMFGYFMNVIFPRLGEISRPVYVARRLSHPSGLFIGTILLERLIDLFLLMVLFLIVTFTLLSGGEGLTGIFGAEGLPASTIALVIGVIVLLLAGGWVVFRWMASLGHRTERLPSFLAKLVSIVESFTRGLVSIRNLNHPVLFVTYSVLIWVFYIVMTWIPFAMLDFGSAYGMGLRDAVVLTMVSAVGITIPTPAGIGTYHLFVQQALHLLNGVPLVEGLTFATISHAATVVLTLLAGPVLLWVDKNRKGLNVG